MTKRLINSYLYVMMLSIASLLSFTALASCNKKDKTVQIMLEQQESAQDTLPPIHGETFSVGDVKFNMIAVKGGSFVMGSNDRDANNDQKPAHNVTLSDFSIGQTEVTQELWQAVWATTQAISEALVCL